MPEQYETPNPESEEELGQAQNDQERIDSAEEEEETAAPESVMLPTAVEEREAQDSPTKEANGDDLADLFRTPKETDPDMRIDDIVAVDLEDDIMDGDLSDLVDVTEEDIMGPAPEPRRKERKIRQPQRVRPYPGLGMSRMEY